MKCKELTMPFKTAVQARWNNVYQWLQETDHVDTHPEGPVFVFLERHELQDSLGEHTLDKGTVEFENENYIAYGYPSYDEMRADFFD